MANEIIHYELQLADCVAEIWLNGIPLARLNSREQNFVSVPALTFLVNGRNLLELVIEPGGTPSQSRSPTFGKTVSRQAKAWARVVRLAEGAFTGDESAPAMGEIRFSGADQSAPLQLPHVLRREFDFQLVKPWAWQNADLIMLDRDRPAIVETLSAIHAAFAAGNAEGVVQRARLYLQEEASAYPSLTAADLTSSLRRDVSRNAGRTGWVAPLNPAEFDLRLCAGNRLVECVSKTWMPLINTLPQDDGSIYPFPMFLGKVAGEWQILR